MQYAELKPNLPASIFPSRSQKQMQLCINPVKTKSKSELVSGSNKTLLGVNPCYVDEFIDQEINDQDLLAAGTKLSHTNR